MHSPPPEYWWAIGIGTVGLLLLTAAFLVTLVVSQTRLRSQLNETRRNESKYRNLFDNSLVGMFRFSLNDLSVVDANKTLLAIFGKHSVAEAAGVFKSIPSDRREAITSALTLYGSLENEEMELTGAAGRRFWISMTCRAHETEGYAEGIVVDITERKLAEDRLLDSHQQLRNLSSRLESVREEERLRIARQVHDDLGQVLTAVKMQLTVMADAAKGRALRSKPGLEKKLESLASVIDHAIDLVRNISSELRPLALEELGLKEAIEWETVQVEKRSGLRFKLETGGEFRLTNEQSTAVFRIFQEALTNIQRHASASLVTIRLFAEAGILILEVTDDGRGITEEQIRHARALGILGMKERAMFLGGQLHVARNNGSGTIVDLRVPLEGNTKALGTT